MADKKEEHATEGVDIDAANRAEDEEPAADPDVTVAVEDAEGESEDSAEETSGTAEDDDVQGTADGSDGDGDGDGDDSEGESDSDGDAAVDLALMDIFTDEEVEVDPFAGSLDEFLEELTMEQVADEADHLLEEFRAI